MTDEVKKEESMDELNKMVSELAKIVTDGNKVNIEINWNAKAHEIEQKIGKAIRNTGCTIINKRKSSDR